MVGPICVLRARRLTCWLSCGWRSRRRLNQAGRWLPRHLLVTLARSALGTLPHAVAEAFAARTSENGPATPATPRSPTRHPGELTICTLRQVRRVTRGTA